MNQDKMMVLAAVVLCLAAWVVRPDIMAPLITLGLMALALWLLLTLGARLWSLMTAKGPKS